MKLIDISKLKSLSQLMYKNVRITTNVGRVYEGEISTYTDTDDSDIGEEYVGIEFSDHIECFTRFTIKSIEEIVLNTDNKICLVDVSPVSLSGFGILFQCESELMSNWSKNQVHDWFDGMSTLVLDDDTRIPIKEVFPRVFNGKTEILIEADIDEFTADSCPIYATVE